MTPQTEHHIMSELVAAASTNDLETLRRLLERDKADHSEPNERDPVTCDMHAAAVAAAKHNHPEAMNILFEAGDGVDIGTNKTNASILLCLFPKAC